MESKPNIQKFEGDFIEFLFAKGVVKFGEFTLKSGRSSPYFLNLGEVQDAEGLNQLGRFYAMLIKTLHNTELIPDPDYLFGPAYKGIVLAALAGTQLENMYGMNTRIGSDRKEAKLHGEGTGGRVNFIGAKPRNGDKVLIIEDVFTTGATKEEARNNILSEAPEANIAGIIIAVDRCEALQEGSNTTAISEFHKKYSIPTHSITNVYNLIKVLHNKEIAGRIALTDEHKSKMEQYLEKYGVKEAA